MIRLPPRGTMRRAVLVGSCVAVLLVLAAMTVLLRAHGRMRDTLTSATHAFIEEQRIADRLLRASSLQLVAASLADRQRNAQVVDQFRASGADVYEQIRRYLFRPLTPDQRRRLEEVREQHQQLEVEVAGVFAFYERGETEAAAAASDAALSHALRLQNSLDEFLALREADLVAMQARQAAAFTYLQLAALGFGLLVLLGPVVLIPYVERRLTRPLEELAEAAGRIGGGEPGVRLPVERDDELGSTAQSFNRMADRLDRARAELGTRNAELAEALHDVEATQAEMVQTEKLAAVGRMMAGLAHEVNNPLASVLGYGELLRQRLEEPGQPPSPEELRDAFVTPLVTEARRARTLTRHLLGVARQPEGGGARVPLDHVLECAVDLRRPSFEQHGLKLELDVGPLPALGVPPRGEQAILNVIDNAREAMVPEGAGSLRITCRELGDRVELCFADDGPGFASPERAFEPFYTTRPTGEGAGLGLSLVHRFVQEVGGTARAANRPEGGALVVLSLPVRALAPPGAEGQDAAEIVEPEGAAEAAAPAPAGMPRPLRVLVVEDEAPLRELQRRFLARLGAEVTLVASAAEAQAALERGTVDLIVSDVKMPGGTGVDLYRWVERERPALSERFLFVTGDIADPAVEAVAARRPVALLRKPFLMEDYLARVKAVAGTG